VEKSELPDYKKQLVKRINEAFDNSPVNKKEISEKLGVSYNTVMKWFRIGSITHKNLKKLSELLEVDFVWLLSGDEIVGVREFTEEYKSDRDVLIPVYDVQLSAGNGTQVPEYIETKKKLPFDQNWLLKNRLKPDNLMILYVYGDSMLPSMADGDSVLIDRSKTKIIDRKIYGIMIGGEMKIKRLKQNFNGSVDVISDNPQHETETIPVSELDHLYIIGQAVYRSGLL